MRRSSKRPEETLDTEQQRVAEDLRRLAGAVRYQKAFRAELRRQLLLRALGTARESHARKARRLPWHERFVVGLAQLNPVLGGVRTINRAIALAIVLFVVAISAVAFVPSVRAQVASWLGFEVAQQATLSNLVVRVLDHAPWDAPAGASFEVLTLEIPQARWAFVERAQGEGFSMPEPGTWIDVPAGRSLPVPAYLPEGYRWQSMATLGENTVLTTGLVPLGSQSAAGGGARLPAYDRKVVNYLIGGDPADHLLILTQVAGDLEAGLLFQAYHVVSPQKQPPSPGEDRSPATPPSSVVPTPTSVPAYYAAKVQVGIVVERVEGREGLVFLAGPGHLHETMVGSTRALWYNGTWNEAGQWMEESAVNLIWEEGGFTYQLTGQDLPLEELIRVAESLPISPVPPIPTPGEP